MNYIMAASYTVLTILYLFKIWDIKRANPVFYFLIFQCVVALGSLLLLDFDNVADQIYGIVIFLSLFMFILGSTVGIKVFNIKKKYCKFFNRPLEPDSRISQNLIIIIVLISVIVVLVYYKMIGYNLSYPMLFGSHGLDMKTLRLATYSGEKYYAPGVVNQFKNVLLPIGFTVLSLMLFTRKKMFLFYLSLIIFGIFLIYALLGTGQRAPLLYALVSIGMGLSIIYNIRIKWLVILFTIMIVGFGIISLNSGRLGEVNIENVLSSIFVRIFYVDQHEGLLGFRYIYGLDTSWFSEWLNGILGILPGHSGSNLDHILYSRINGTLRGTSSLSIPGSVYYNGSMYYVFILYFIFGFMYTYLYSRLISGRKTIIRSMGYGGIIFLISVFVMGSPATLFNKGLLGFILILFIRKLCIKKPISTYVN